MKTLLGFVLAMSLTMVLIPLLMRWAATLGFLDHPEERKVHTTPVPRVGGIAMAVAVLLVLLVAVEDGVAVINRECRPAIFQIALVLVIAHHDERIEPGVVERLADMGDRGARLVLPRDDFGGLGHGRHFGIGLFQ